MDFRLANTFTVSLDRLTGEEQKAVKTADFLPPCSASSDPLLPANQGEGVLVSRYWSLVKAL